VMDVQRDDHQGGGTRDRDVYPGSAFTPDSRALITSYGGRIMRVAIPSGEVTEIPFTARVEQQLGPLVKFDYPINDSTLTSRRSVAPGRRRTGGASCSRRSTGSGSRTCPRRAAGRALRATVHAAAQHP
jgi:hypothetical protein